MLDTRWENPGRGLPQRPACGYDGQAATRLAHTRRRSNSGRKIYPRRFWRYARQLEYILNKSPSCPTNRGHLNSARITHPNYTGERRAVVFKGIHGNVGNVGGGRQASGEGFQGGPGVLVFVEQ